MQSCSGNYSQYREPLHWGLPLTPLGDQVGKGIHPCIHRFYKPFVVGSLDQLWGCPIFEEKFLLIVCTPPLPDLIMSKKASTDQVKREIQEKFLICWEIYLQTNVSSSDKVQWRTSAGTQLLWFQLLIITGEKNSGDWEKMGGVLLFLFLTKVSFSLGSLPILCW